MSYIVHHPDNMLPGEHYDFDEFCPYCDEYIPVSFDGEVSQDDLETICPVCGNRLMLCSACGVHCDYADGYGCCMDNNHRHAPEKPAQPERKILSDDEWLKSIGKFKGVAIRILEAVENMLEEKNITIPDDDRTGEPSEARLYGCTYGNLEDEIADILRSYFHE